MPKYAQSSSSILVSIFNGKKTVSKTIYTKNVTVVGQTSGEWVAIGIQQFASGTNNYVQITDTGADGQVVADAILLVPVR